MWNFSLLFAHFICSNDINEALFFKTKILCRNRGISALHVLDLTTKVITAAWMHMTLQVLVVIPAVSLLGENHLRSRPQK